jgi:hypothetical protein
VRVKTRKLLEVSHSKDFLASKNYLQQLFELNLTMTLSLMYTLYRKEYSSSESVIAQGFGT